ncbi:MAG: VOC family protein [Deltaproteobacteria bacterium]|nr:VOC family protein [Deltaproteobacteria bacterium]
MTNPQPKAPRLGYVILYVPDVATSVSFYERAFGVARRFVHESGTYAEMETGATALAFADETSTPNRGAFRPNRASELAAAAEVAFVVEDVRAAFVRALENGAISVLEPSEKPWGQTVSYVRDLDGFLVEICSAIGA